MVDNLRKTKENYIYSQTCLRIIYHSVGKNGEKPMLETSQERVELLKTGISYKKIEELYVIHNNYKIIYAPVPLHFMSGK